LTNDAFEMHVTNCNYLRSDYYGSSVFVMTFAEDSLPPRYALADKLVMQVGYVPHMILTEGLALTRANRAFLVSMANSLHGMAIQFDKLCINTIDTALIYNAHISRQDEYPSA
jgi:hypothetical protein